MSRVMGRGDNQGPLPTNLPEGAVISSESQPRTPAGRELVEDEPRLVTGEHSMLTRVLAIEAEAAQDSRPLDVERLARAIAECGLFTCRGDTMALVSLHDAASEIATAYARLAAEKPHD